MEHHDGIETLFPLSPLQEGLIFHSLLDLEADVYVNQAVYALAGDLDLARFSAAWRRVSERHAMLRTGFVWQRDRLMHVTFARFEIPLAVEDWRGDPPEVQRRALDERLADDRRRRFALTDSLLFRLALFRTSDRAWTLVCSHHHALLDGWSSAMLLEEALAFYRALERGVPLYRPAPRPYSDYVEWLSRQDRTAAEIFWRRLLGDLAAATPLPQPLHDPAPQPAGRGRAFAVVPIDGLQQVAARERLTVGSIVQALWSLLLARHAGERDVVWGATVSMRSDALGGSDSIAGLLVNTLPLRARLEGQRPAAEWMRDLQTEWAEAREYGYLSLTELHALTMVPRAAPLFETLFTFENYPVNVAADGAGEDAAGPRVVDAHVEERDVFPIELIAVPSDRLRLQLHYERPRYASTDAENLLDQMACLIQSFVEAPRAVLDALGMLRAAGRARLLASGTGRTRSAPARDVVSAIYERVAATPDAIAVEQDDQAWTYRALSGRIAAWAQSLRALGIAPERRVGVVLDRSADLVAIMLAVWDAGGVYVPIDAGYPAERIGSLLADGEVSVVIATRLHGAAVESAQVPVIWVDDVGALEPLADLAAPPPHSAQLAYMVYTSGSTGRPKGALLEHRGLANHVAAKIETLALTERDIVALTASPSFDISIWQMVAPLEVGGRIRVLGDAARDWNATLDDVDRSGITIVETVPAFLGAWLDGERAAGPDRRRAASLRWMICNGEPLPPAMVQDWQSSYPHATLINAYGATECSDDVSHWVAGEGPVLSSCAPLGRALAQTSLHVLDDDGRLTAPGVAGELYLGGIGVGRGYWRQPALTAARWVPDAVGSIAGARVYRTGDRVRWGWGDSLEFVGRRDRQIKLRGFRIELEEVEAALQACPGVQGAAAILQTIGDQPRLIGYVASTDPAVTPASIRKAQLARVPEHLVPSRIIVLDQLPLTPNGKIDRHALPPPDELESTPSDDRPDTPTEQVLAAIWQDILRCHRLGRSDNFFAVGGDSLLATQAMSRIRAAFGIEFPLRALFEGTDLADVATRIDATRRRHLPPPPPIRRRPSVDDPPLSFAQIRMWFVEQLQPASAGYNVPLGCELRGPLDVRALERAFADIIGRHEVLRTGFADDDGRPRAVVRSAVSMQMAVVDVSALSAAGRDAAATAVAYRDARRPFDLIRPPLIRVTLVRLEPRRHWLRLTMHHIVTDGWSTGVVGRELSELYGVHAAGRTSRLEELPLQYGDFAAWQQQWLRGEVLEQHTRYWSDAIADVPPLDLPTDFPRPPIASFRAAEIRFVVEASAANDVRTFARREGATLFMALLTAWQTLLARVSGHRDFAVGSPIANRTRQEVEGLIGFFINTLVLRTRGLSPTCTFRGLLRHVRETTLSAYEHQDLPFEKLIEQLNPERDTSRSPLFQVMLVVQNTPHEELALDGLEVTGLHLAQAVTPFEMILAFTEEEDGRLEGVLQYAADLFSAERIERTIGQLQVVLAAMVSAPEQQVEDVAWLTAAERTAVVEQWPYGEILPATPGVMEQIAAVVARAPAAIAVSAGAAQVSYEGLATRVRQWAAVLTAAGVGPDVRVGICLERELELVAISLGVLQAGGAYVPLDPVYPVGRLQQMLIDSGARVVVGTVAAAARLGPGPWQWLAIETTQLPADTSAPAVTWHPAQLAQVIYTSGSTGTPKGVGVHYGGMSHTAAAVVQRIDSITDASRVLQFASWSFDAATWEWLVALTTGARLVLSPAEPRLPGDGLEALLAEQQVTVAALPPSVLSALDPTGLDALTTVVAAIEACPADVVARWAPERRLVNGYGQTESTIASVVSAPLAGRETPVLGRPLPGVDVYVLDAAMEPVAAGVPGEIYVGGGGVTRGYVGQARWTARQFVPHPFSARPGARLYRTGDRGRWRDDGQLEFVGRVDAQVKLRGYRIELPEIEHALAQLPGVRGAVVRLQPSDAGEPQVVGYVIGAGLDGAEVRRAVSDRLPAYMVPSAIVVLAAWPLTVHGKIDMKALPATAGAPAPDAQPPQTPTELLLTDIWRDVLACGAVARTDDFFARGGHSLLATQVVSRIRSLFHLELPLRTLFEATTLVDLASRIDESMHAGRDSALASSTLVFGEAALIENITHLPEEDIDLLIDTLSNPS